MTGMWSTVAVEADVRSIIRDPGRCGSTTGSWRPRPRLAGRAGATDCPGRGPGRVPWVVVVVEDLCRAGPPGGVRQAALEVYARVGGDVLHVLCVVAALGDDPEGASLQAVADGRDASLPAAPPGLDEGVARRRSPQRERKLVHRVDDGLLQSLDDAASHFWSRSPSRCFAVDSWGSASVMTRSS